MTMSVIKTIYSRFRNFKRLKARIGSHAPLSKMPERVQRNMGNFEYLLGLEIAENADISGRVW